MSKAQDQKKETKKEPAKTMKEMIDLFKKVIFAHGDALARV